MPDPYISVIVTAYNRKKYLPEALRSLERQTLDKEKFEVIVVKNFEDPVSDEIIRRNGWRWVYSDERFYGRSILAGAEEARGEVVTFLDDDDMYVPERLRAVEEAFKAIRGLAYFHNEQIMVDEDGKPIDYAASKHDLLTDNPSKICQELFLKGRYANNSSIAVPLWLIDQLRSYLYHIITQFDLAIVGAIKPNGHKMFLSGEKLTLWRIHRNSFFTYAVHAYVFRDKKKDWKEIVTTYVRTVALWAIDTAETLKLMSDHPCRPYVEWLELVRRLEASAAPDWALEGRPRSSPLDFLRVLYLRLGGKSQLGLKFMSTLAVDSVISWLPNSIREAWWRLRWRSG